MKGSFFLRSFRYQLGFIVVFTSFCLLTSAQDYEVADIDCAVGSGGNELLTARLRRPEGFRGTPIFADDRGSSLPSPLTSSPRDPAALIAQELLHNDSPCQIHPDTSETSGRVFKLRVTDFSQCGVLKRNGFIHVRVWFPQLPGVVMLSDQEVIIMCKPPAATIVQSKTAGFAGSIPSGARVSGIVEESPGRLEYEVALYRETSPSMAARSSSSSSAAVVTGIDSHELPVDQAVPIGTRLQLRAKINHESAWKHAKLMEVSVSPDPKNPNAEGSVSLVRDGCRNADLASIIPKQPYRYKERSNEVVLDFEAFLLSNMGDRSTLWLHTQIKACMESQDCTPQDFCMDVYHPSGFGRRRRRRRSIGPSVAMTSTSGVNGSSGITGMEYSAPLSQHWRTVSEDIILDNVEEVPPGGGFPEHRMEEEVGGGAPFHFDLHAALVNETAKKLVDVGSLTLAKKLVPQVPPEAVVSSSGGALPPRNVHKEDIDSVVLQYKPKVTPGPPKMTSKKADEKETAKFGDNIGFSVVMPSDYYRSEQKLSPTLECKGWATAAAASLLCALFAGLLACGMSYKLRMAGGGKEKGLYTFHGGPQVIHPVRTHKEPSGVLTSMDPSKGGDSRVTSHLKYARDPSIYRS